MGGGSWSAKDWTSYSSTVHNASMDAIYTSRDLDDSLNPKGVKIRESKDSDDNPQSTAMIVALDVTGSMGGIAVALAKEGLGTLFKEILGRKPITNPHLMFMAVGDVRFDKVPLQVSQFEADNRIIEQLTKIYIEGRGGGNQTESYEFPWYFAAKHTQIDCFDKRGKKGYLFTIGDEDAPEGLTVDQIKKVTGDVVQADISASELLAMAERNYNVFHIIIEEGNGFQASVTKSWNKLLGQRAIHLTDYTKLSEVIVSTIQVIEGEDKAKVVDSWDGSTSVVVKNAIKDLAADVNTSTGIVVF
jgi:hypothetical protein